MTTKKGTVLPFMRTLVLAFVAGLFAAVSIGASLPARAVNLEQQADFDIPAQPIPSALVLFSRQAGVQVVTATKDLEGIQGSEVRGRFSLRDAVTRLLEKTGLTYAIAGEGTVVVGKGANLSSVELRPVERQSESHVLLAQAQGAGQNERERASSSKDPQARSPEERSASDKVAARPADQAERIEKILVTGTNISGPPEKLSTVVTY